MAIVKIFKLRNSKKKDFLTNCSLYNGAVKEKTFVFFIFTVLVLQEGPKVGLLQSNLVKIFLVLLEGPKVGLLQLNLVKIFLVLLEVPKVGLLQSNLVKIFLVLWERPKIALIYSVATIYLGLHPKIIQVQKYIRYYLIISNDDFFRPFMLTSTLAVPSQMEAIRRKKQVTPHPHPQCPRHILSYGSPHGCPLDTVSTIR